MNKNKNTLYPNLYDKMKTVLSSNNLAISANMDKVERFQT